MPKDVYQSDLKKLQLNKQFLIVLTLLFVVLIIWTFVTISASQNKTIITAEQTKLALPLTPVLDRDVFADLAAKPHFTEQELENFTIYKLVTLSDKEQVVLPIDAPNPTPSSNRPGRTSTASPSASPAPQGSF